MLSAERFSVFAPLEVEAEVGFVSGTEVRAAINAVVLVILLSVLATWLPFVPFSRFRALFACPALMGAARLS